MSFRFIYGRSGSGKSHFCLQNIKDKVNSGSDSPLILLIPEQFSFQTEKNVLQVLGEQAGDRVQVLSFRKLAQMVAYEVGGITKQHLDAAGKSMLLFKIVDDNYEQLNVFKKASKAPGFINIISDIISEFKNYSIEPQQLMDMLQGTEDEVLRLKLKDIYLIFSQFEEILHQNYIDSDDDLKILESQLDSSIQFDEAQIWIDEFSSFTTQEYRIIEKLMKKSSSVSMALCMDNCNSGEKLEVTDVFLPTKNTEEKMLNLLKENNIKYEAPINLESVPSYRFKESKELQHLEKHLFSFPCKPYIENTESVKLFRATNKYSEVEEAAKDIIRNCREQGTRFRDISIVTGDLEGYESLIRAVFKQYDIPYFIDKKRDIMSSSIVVLLLSVLDILNKNYSYESVFKYLKTGLLDMEFDEIDLVENYVILNGIKGKRWLEPWLPLETLEGEQLQFSAEKLEKINVTREKIIAPLVKFNESIKGRKNGRDICRGVYEFLIDINAVKKIEDIIGNFKKINALDKVKEYTQIWNIVIEGLDQLVDILGDEPLSREQFTKILKTGLEQYEVGVIPPALDGILVGSVTRVRSHQVSHLYILGVNDGVFPQGAMDQGILSDKDRINLNSRGLEIGKDNKTLAFEEQFLIYSTMTIMNKYLRISFPMADGQGKSKRPSIIISRLKKIFPNILEESNVAVSENDQAVLKSISSQIPTFNGLISAIRKNSEDSYMNGIWMDVYRWYEKSEVWKDSLERNLRSFNYSNQAEIFDTKKARKLYGTPLTTSVSKLERYAACPFSYFVQYGLKANERKVYKISSPDMGSFMHEVLKRISVSLKESNLSWLQVDKKWCENKVNETVADILDKAPRNIFNSSKRHAYVASSMKKILKRSVVMIMEHIKRGGFVPMGYELSFGQGGDYPAITISLNSGEEVSIIGRVDRVDSLVDENSLFLRIIDYKSGIKEFKLSEAYHGLQMQLLVYLDAILTEASKNTETLANPGAVFYFRLDDPILKVKGEITEEEIQQKLMKSSKMSGLVVNDPDVIRAMDKNIGTASDIIPVSMKVDGTASQSKSSVASLEQFNQLRNFVRGKIVSLCENMLEGKIDIEPFKWKNGEACTYCLYSSVCQFDSSITCNNYKQLKNLKDEEVWNLLSDDIF